MAITKIHAVKVRLGDAINYIENPDKTDGQELISGYNTAHRLLCLIFPLLQQWRAKHEIQVRKSKEILPTT